jgi:alpha-tubulin suppressor-like RCC1 family protein
MTNCFKIIDQHDVWIWGYGILGQGPKVRHSDNPLLLPPTLFGRNDFNPDAKTTSVHCGVHTNAAINSYGDLYTWGKNSSSCLGLGDWKDQFFPFKVNMGGSVTKISLGIDHSAALCKPYD